MVLPRFLVAWGEREGGGGEAKGGVGPCLTLIRWEASEMLRSLTRPSAETST